MNNNKVINRQISINSIIEVAKYLENHKSEYDKQFELEENKNKNIINLCCVRFSFTFCILPRLYIIAYQRNLEKKKEACFT